MYTGLENIFSQVSLDTDTSHSSRIQKNSRQDSDVADVVGPSKILFTVDDSHHFASNEQ